MRRTTAFMAAALASAIPAHAGISSGDPDLPIRFMNAIPDICFPATRDHPPSKESAAKLLLEPVSTVPPTIGDRRAGMKSWFVHKAHPENIFIGVGDRPGACHVILANTTDGRAILGKVAGLLMASGFHSISDKNLSKDFIDFMFVKEAPDGYMLVSLQGAFAPLRGGDGEQAAVHVNRMTKAAFEAIASPGP